MELAVAAFHQARETMEELHEFMTERRLPVDMRIRLRGFFHHRFSLQAIAHDSALSQADGREMTDDQVPSPEEILLYSLGTSMK